MTDISKLAQAIDYIAEKAALLPEEYRVDGLNVLLDAEKSLKRVLARAKAPAELESFTLPDTKGPTLSFMGRVIASDQYRTRSREPLNMEMTLYETQGGAYIAQTVASPAEQQGFEDARLTIVEPAEDEQARRFAVMDAFGWTDRARSMVRKLGWTLRQDVE